jgi:hypothetical protein
MEASDHFHSIRANAKLDAFGDAQLACFYKQWGIMR